MENEYINKLSEEDRIHLHKVMDAANDEGWGTKIVDDELYLSNHSPAGEDITFSVSLDTPGGDIYREYEEFDIDEHVEMWLPKRGTDGVPWSIVELVEDAKAIEEMLYDLCDAVGELI